MNQQSRTFHEILHGHSYEKDGFNLPIQVTMALYSRWGKGDFFEYRKKPLMSVNMVTLGSADFIQDGRRGSIGTGGVFLARKGSDQRFVTGPSGILHKRTIILDGSLLDVLLERTGLQSADAVLPRDPGAIVALMRRMYALLRDKPTGFAQRASALAYEMIVALGESIAPQHPVALRRSVDFISRSLGAFIGLADIAAAGDTSVRQCNRIFLRHFGCSPVRFLINQRMSIASDMLLNSTMSIKQVADRVGYGDPLYFSDQFRKRFGVSPREFRKAGQKS